jgi:hypothetical protein
MDPVTVSGRVVQGLAQGFGREGKSAPAIELEEAAAEELAGTEGGPDALERLREQPDSSAAQLILQGRLVALIEGDEGVGRRLQRVVERLDLVPEELWCGREEKPFPADRFAFMPRRGIMHVIKAHYPGVRQSPPGGPRYPDDIDDDPPPPPGGPSGVLDMTFDPGTAHVHVPDRLPLRPVRFHLTQDDALVLVFRPTSTIDAAGARTGARHYEVDLPQQALTRWSTASPRQPGGEPGRLQT